jgi:putative transposase
MGVSTQASIRVCKLRLYPTNAQVITIWRWFHALEQTWTHLRDAKQNSWEQENKTLTLYDLNMLLPHLRSCNPELAAPQAVTQQNLSHRLTAAYKSFFTHRKNGNKKARVPRRSKHIRSMTFPSQFQVLEGKIRAGKLGWIKARGTLPDEEYRTFTLKLTRTGKWMAYLTYKVELIHHIHTVDKVGVDLGMEKYLTTSDGYFAPNTRIFRRYDARIAKLNRKLSRQQRGSRRRYITVKLLRRAYEDRTNAMMDYVHKLSTQIANRYKTIYVEDLNIKAMIRGYVHRVGDMCWRTFLDLLEYKVKDRGGQLVYVNPRGTSQYCSMCGEYVHKNLGERIHQCPVCGYTTDRDHNASINVLKRGEGFALTEKTPLPETTPYGMGSVISEFNEVKSITTLT